MANHLINLTGQRFGRLLVLGRGENGKAGKPRWNCLCDCGKHRLVYRVHLVSKDTVSCGCWAKGRMFKHGCSSGTPEYVVWHSMLTRCFNPKSIGFKHYGGRGITVCERWRHSFENFLSDMGPRPKGRTLDRIDHDKNYEPGNCRWATQREQMRNTRVNHIIEFNGKAQTLIEWAEELGIGIGCLQTRVLRGWPVEQAFFKPKKKYTRNLEEDHAGANATQSAVPGGEAEVALAAAGPGAD